VECEGEGVWGELFEFNERIIRGQLPKSQLKRPLIFGVFLGLFLDLFLDLFLGGFGFNQAWSKDFWVC
jgi:hypothetical protein